MPSKSPASRSPRNARRRSISRGSSGGGQVLEVSAVTVARNESSGKEEVVLQKLSIADDKKNTFFSRVYLLFSSLYELIDWPFKRFEEFSVANEEPIKFLKKISLLAFSGYAVYQLTQIQEELMRPISLREIFTYEPLTYLAVGMFGDFIDRIHFIPKVMSYQWRLGTMIVTTVKSTISPATLGFILACYGHTIVYAFIFIILFAFANIVHFAFLVAPVTLVLWWFDCSDISVMNLHIGTCLVLLQIGLSYIAAVKSLTKIFDSIPRIVSYSITYSIAVVDQISHCFFTNVCYNRLAWMSGWFAFAGMIHPPLTFCIDNRAHGKHYWYGAGDCPNPSYHTEVLNCMCKIDLGCGSYESTANNELCNVYCNQETNRMNILRLFDNVDLCLGFGHVMFISLIFAIVFQAVYKLQKQAIIHGTVSYGLYLWSYYDDESTSALAVLTKATGVAVATTISYPALITFQNIVACRLTRSIGLDLSPPDAIPLSPAEAWTIFISSCRIIFVSVCEGVGIAVSVLTFRYYIHNQLQLKEMPYGFCNVK